MWLNRAAEALAKLIWPYSRERSLLEAMTLSAPQHLTPAQAANAKAYCVKQFIEYVQSPEFCWVPAGTYMGAPSCVSSGGYVFLDDDIYGYEIKLFSRTSELLDGAPGFYNLTRDQAQNIFDALAYRYTNRRRATGKNA